MMTLEANVTPVRQQALLAYLAGKEIKQWSLAL
jgi:hypothetical protein